MNKLKCINLFTFGDAIDFLSLTDIGISELGRLSVEELLLKDAAYCSGSFLVDWILNESPLIHSLKVLTLSNVKCDYFHLFKEFKNLETLELNHNPSDLSLDENEMNDTRIEFPASLTSLKTNYPLTHKNMKEITQHCTNLKELIINPISLDDDALSLTLSSVSKTVENFTMLPIIKQQDDADEPSMFYGKYYSVFSSNTFTYLKSLQITWKITTDKIVTNLQQNLSLLSPTLERLRINLLIHEGSDVDGFPIDGLLKCLTKLSKLQSLHIDIPLFSDLIVENTDVLDKLQNAISLKYLKIVGSFSKTHTINIMKSLMGHSLEEFKCTDREELDQRDLGFLNGCDNLTVLKIAGRGTFSENGWYLQFLLNSKLEKVYGDSIHASLIQYLPRHSLKYLSVKVDSLSIRQFKYLEEFQNLETLNIEFLPSTTNLDFSEYTLPKSIRSIEFSEGELTGTEKGFCDWLYQAHKLKELTFMKCHIQDQFIKNIIPMSNELDILKMQHNEGLTHVSTEYFRQFTNCRVLLLKCYNHSVISSKYSLFEQESSRITVIMNEGITNDHPKIDPALNYSKVDQVMTFVKEKIDSKEMNEAFVVLDTLLCTNESVASKHENADQICKMMLLASQHYSYLPSAELNSFKLLNELWNEKRITFEDVDIKSLCKIINVISYQKPFSIVANILLDLGKFSTVFEALEGYLSNFTDIDEHEDCTIDLIERVLQFFLSGQQDICAFSGHIIEGTVTTLTQDFSDHPSLSKFTDLVMRQEFYNSSKKTLTELSKQRFGAAFDEDKVEPTVREKTTENVMEFAQEYLPKLKRDFSLHVATVKVPKIGPFNTFYRSEPFIEFGYEWTIEFVPIDDDEGPNQCSIYLTLNSTLSNDDDKKKKPFDRIRLNFFISNFDLEPQSYLVHSRKYDMPDSSYGFFVNKDYIQPYSTIEDKEFLIFKFIVGLKHVDELPYSIVPNIESFHHHHGRRELSSTNYPPIIHRMAAELPISIHTLTFRTSPENIDRAMYSDQFTAFGVKFAVCFSVLGNAQKVKSSKENSSAYIYLCSFDYNDKPKELDSIKFKAVFANSDFDTESMYIFKETMSSMTNYGNTLNRRCFQPKLIEVNGKPYYEYSMNVCIGLMAIQKHPTTDQNSSIAQNGWGWSTALFNVVKLGCIVCLLLNLESINKFLENFGFK